MSERSKPRKPAAFILDDPQVVVSLSPDEASGGERARVLVTPAPDEAASPPAETETLPRAPR